MRTATLALVMFGALLLPILAPAEDAAAPAETKSPQHKAKTEARAKIDAQLQELEAAHRKLKEIAAARDAAADFERRELQHLFDTAQLRLGGLAHDLANALIVAGADNGELGSARTRVLEVMRDMPPQIGKVLDERRDALAAAVEARDSAKPEQLIQAEQAITAATNDLDEIFAFYVRHVALMESLGLNNEAALKDLVTRLQEQAHKTAARIQLTMEEKSDLQRFQLSSPDSAAARQRLAVLNVRFASMTASLRREVNLLNRLDQDTLELSKLLVRATGDISVVGFNLDVVVSLIKDWVRQGRDWLVRNALTLVLRLTVIALVLVAAWFASRVARRLVRRALRATSANISQLLQHTLVGLTGVLVLLIGGLFALSQFGISVAPMLAGLGIAGFIIGFALQDTLANFASGGMILFYRPFDVGDFIEAAGVTGTVRQMNLVSTTILTPDHQTLIVPNKKIWGDVIRNITQQEIRRVDLMIGVSYQDDIEHVERVLGEIVKNHPKVLGDPPPDIKLHLLDDSAVKYVVRPWVRKENYWEVYWDLMREVKRRFDAEGICIPFPQREIHVRESGSGKITSAVASGGDQQPAATGAPPGRQPV